MSHTPGPWELIEGDIWSAPIEGGCTMAKGRCMVAQVRGWGHLQYRPDGEEMQDANGRLIAAAPDLLAALRDLVAISSGKHDDNAYNEEWTAAEDRARAAIAKAEGKS